MKITVFILSLVISFTAGLQVANHIINPDKLLWQAWELSGQSVDYGCVAGRRTLQSCGDLMENHMIKLQDLLLNGEYKKYAKKKK